MRILRKQLAVRPIINTSNCALCKACVSNCSAHAIEEINRTLKINEEKCIHCYCCRELCPNDAVELKKITAYEACKQKQKLMGELQLTEKSSGRLFIKQAGN